MALLSRFTTNQREASGVIPLLDAAALYFCFALLYLALSCMPRFLLTPTHFHHPLPVQLHNVDEVGNYVFMLQDQAGSSLVPRPRAIFVTFCYIRRNLTADGRTIPLHCGTASDKGTRVLRCRVCSYFVSARFSYLTGKDPRIGLHQDWCARRADRWLPASTPEAGLVCGESARNRG